MAGKKPEPPKSLLPPELSWSTHEKEQTWVPRYAEAGNGKRVESALWRYCVSRHKQRWLGTKRHSGPPLNYSEGQGIGWWFPKLWTKEFKPIERIFPDTDRPSNPEMAARLERVFSGAATVGIGSHPFPSFDEFRSWKLPVGTQIVAADGTVVYPDGAVETWISIQRRTRKPAPPKPSKPEPLAEEPAATPSPELIATMKRKEWLAKAERGEVGGSDAADPDAWRSEMGGDNGR